MKIATQGFPGSYHHQAIEKIAKNIDSVEIISRGTFTEVFDDIKNNAADAGLVAIENTIYGNIYQNIDSISSNNFWIEAETVVPIKHQLIGFHSSPKQIYSHPIALEQCSSYIQMHFPGAEIVETNDTASAAEYVANNPVQVCAAIASVRAAALYDVPIIDASIEDFSDNMTRFYLVRKFKTMPSEETNRTFVQFELQHSPGSLASLLSRFAEKSINISMIVSRPIPHHPFSYKFYVIADAPHDAVTSIFGDSTQHAHSVVVLGSYLS